MSQSECVRVVIRVRPMSENEIEDGRMCVAIVSQNQREISIRNPKNPSEESRSFTFDAVYSQESTQDQIYSQSAYFIVQSTLEGYNGTIFAYGQTGTGKTYTMEGKDEPPEQRGIIPRAFEQIFFGMEQSPDKQFLVRASSMEIYNEEIRDLLAKNPKNRLELKERVDSGVYVKDLSAFVVKNIEELREIMIEGRNKRATGETLMNERSSRSHSIFTITIEQSEIGVDGQPHYRVGKLNLVDLAGSERQSKTGTTGERLKEATKINLSLSTLGNVISALVDGKSTHIPYRDSKLTRILQDSLGGNTKTVMIANLGPADYNFDESLSTLRYANRAKAIKNQPHINEDPKDAMLRQFQEEINKLKEMLQLQAGESQPGQFVGEARVIEKEKIVKIEDEFKIKALEDRLEQEKLDIKAQAELERTKIEAQLNVNEEEKNKILEEIKKRERENLKAKQHEQKMAKKLKKMENKLVQGSQMIEQAVRQEQELIKKQQELEARKRQEQQMLQELQRQEEEQLMVESKHKNLKEELEDKTRKLQKIQQKFQQADHELNDLKKEYGRDREDMTDTIRELQRQFKLKNKLIDYFIPEVELQRIEAYAQWSDDIDD